MFFEKLWKRKEGQTIERVEPPPIETTKTVDDTASTVFVTDGQKHDHDFRMCLKELESKLHTSESTEEIMRESLKAACEFYDAEFAGILIADVETEAWSPVVCYNSLTGNHISRYTKETESFEGFSRWVSAFYQTEPLVIPDTSILKRSNPDEYAHYQRLDVQNLIGAPFGEKPTGFFVVKNLHRYQTIPDMAQMLAFVSMSTYYLQELQENYAMLQESKERAQDAGVVHINLLGNPEVRIGAHALNMEKYPSAKGWSIIGYLALKNKEIPAKVIVRDIWPDTNPKNAPENLRSTLYQMRGKFSHLCPDFIKSYTNGYWFNNAYPIVIDALQAEELWEKSQKETSVALKVEYWKAALALFRGNLYNDLLDESWLMTYYHRFSGLYSNIIGSLLDELGAMESYAEIHKYASASLEITKGNPKVYYWLLISTQMISGYEAARATLNSFGGDLTDEELDDLKVQVNTYLAEHGRPKIE